MPTRRLDPYTLLRLAHRYKAEAKRTEASHAATSDLVDQREFTLGYATALDNAARSLRADARALTKQPRKLTKTRKR